MFHMQSEVFVVSVAIFKIQIIWLLRQSIKILCRFLLIPVADNSQR